MRRRHLKWLMARLKQLKAMTLTRAALLMKLDAARQKAPAAWRLLDVRLAETGASFTYALNRDKLRQARRREGRYLLPLAEGDPADLWAYYLQLVAVEEAFKTIKGDLAIRPIFHQNIERIEAHIFVAFLAYRLYVTLARRLNPLAPGLTARSVIEKFAADDRPARAHHRRPRAAPDPLHRTGARVAAHPRQAPPRLARPANPDHRHKPGPPSRPL